MSEILERGMNETSVFSSSKETTEWYLTEPLKDANKGLPNLLMSLYPLEFWLYGMSKRWVNVYAFDLGNEAIHHPVLFTLQRLIWGYK